MAITTQPDKRLVRVRFLKGTCVDGVDYGPEHRDEPVDVPRPFARLHVDHLGRAEYVLPDEVHGSAALPFEPDEVSIADLEEALAGVDDAGAIRQLMALDARKTARPHYAARLEELES